MFTHDPLYKKIFKYSVLLSIKESYLFFKNWWGMVEHPFKTWRSLFREQDLSQVFLLIGTPIWLLGSGLFGIWFARRLWGATPGIWGIPTKGGVLFTVLIAGMVFAYLSFWIFKVVTINVKFKMKNAKLEMEN